MVQINQFTGQVTFLSGTLHSGFKDIEALAFVPGVPQVPVEMQAVRAWRDDMGAHLQWEARSDEATFVVQRALRVEGPWQEVARVSLPESGRSGAWRYGSVDGEAARAELAGIDLVYRVGAQDAEGAWSWIRFDVESAAPQAARLEPNHPNPFNPSTAFGVRLASSSRLEVSVYDVRGQLVRSLRSGILGAGAHTLVWDGRDGSGRVMPAGIYPWVLSADGQVLRGRAVLVK
jgi:hypothetical protein